MSLTVQVLCPNGHRQNIKASNNTKLLKILEEVCTKQGYRPIESYELKQGKKLLDLTSTVMFSGLSNHAKLDLVKSTLVRKESDIRVALQLEDGTRIQGVYNPSTSLWQILQKSEELNSAYKDKLASSSSGHPVCIYMREEVIGEYALTEHSLRDLGLTGGNAVIRLLHKDVKPELLQKVRQSIDKEKERLVKLEKKASERNSVISFEEPSTSSEPMDVDQASIKHSSSSMQVSETRFSPDVEENAAIIASRFMPSIFPTESKKKKVPRQAPVMPPVQVLPPQMPVEPFKFPEETKGKDVYENEFSAVDKEEFMPCDRETILYHTNTKLTERSSVIDDVPENFFEITEEDVKKRYADLQKQTAQLNDRPLQTGAMRLIAQDMKADHYKRAIIRIHFPDRHILQAVFRSRETVHAIYKFVQSQLEESDLPFYLYTTPPRAILKDKAQLIVQTGLLPMAVVHFGSEEKREIYLKTKLYKELKSQDVADQVIVKHLPTSEPKPGSSSQPKPSATEKTSVKHSADSAINKEKVPKWLKLGKK